jgi:hypothetical protein
MTSTPLDTDQLRRWRLILGKDSHEPLSGLGGGGSQLSADQALMDEALAAIYDETEGRGSRENVPPASAAPRRGWRSGSGTSAPTSPKTW